MSQIDQLIDVAGIERVHFALFAVVREESYDDAYLETLLLSHFDLRSQACL